MRILVIDDRPENLQSAQFTLGNCHEVTLVSTIREAFDIFSRYAWSDSKEPFPFDIVMTDVNLETDEIEEKKLLRHRLGHCCPENVPESLPAGLVFALATINLGKKVAILTDRDHHQDWLSNLLDLVMFSKERPGQSAQVFRTPSPKNWGLALRKLLGEEKSDNYYVEPTKYQTDLDLEMDVDWD